MRRTWSRTNFSTLPTFLSTCLPFCLSPISLSTPDLLKKIAYFTVPYGLRELCAVIEITLPPNKRFSILRRNEAEMGALLDVGQYSNAVEDQAGDVELEWDAYEAGHWIVEENLGCQGEPQVSSVLDMGDNLQIIGALFVPKGPRLRERERILLGGLPF